MQSCESPRLAPELTAYIDSLQDDNAAMGDAGLVDLHLTYGSDELQDRWLERLDAEVAGSTNEYVSDIEKFLSTSPDYGLPSYVFGSYDARPEFQPSGWALDNWLEVAVKHLPGIENEVTEEIVSCITFCFDDVQFKLAAPLTIEDPNPYESGDAEDRINRAIRDVQNKLDRRARELVSVTVDKLYKYTTDVDTIQRFIDSSLMKAYGGKVGNALLGTRILELQNKQSSPAYAALVADVEQENMSSVRILNDSTEPTWLLRRDPSAALRLSEQHSSSRDARTIQRIGCSVLQSVKSDDRTEEHDTILTKLEQQLSNDTQSFIYLLEEYVRINAPISLDHLRTLQKLLLEATDNSDENRTSRDWAYQLLYANLPLHEAMDLAQHTSATRANPETAAIYIRRLANEGRIEKAYDAARHNAQPEDYRYEVRRARNFLHIYDITGDIKAYQEAESLLNAQDTNSIDWSYEGHELWARIFLAAKKHGHVQYVENAFAQMEPYYTHKYTHISEKALCQMVRFALDASDITMAADYAARLYHMGTKPSNDAVDYLLHVLEGYVREERTEDAVRLVQNYFAIDHPSSTLATALQLLQKKQPRYMPHLYSTHLDPTTPFITSAQTVD